MHSSALRALAVLVLAALAQGCALGRSHMAKDATIVIDSSFTPEEVNELLRGAWEWEGHKELGLHWRYLFEGHEAIKTVDLAPWHPDTIYVYRQEESGNGVGFCPQTRPKGPGEGDYAMVTRHGKEFPIAYTCVALPMQMNHLADQFAHELGHAYNLTFAGCADEDHYCGAGESVMTVKTTGPVQPGDVLIWASEVGL